MGHPVRIRITVVCADLVAIIVIHEMSVHNVNHPLKKKENRKKKVKDKNKMGRVFANGLGHLGSIPGRVIPKTLKMVLDTSSFNTQQNKVRIKGKVEQS